MGHKHRNWVDAFDELDQGEFEYDIYRKESKEKEMPEDKWIHVGRKNYEEALKFISEQNSNQKFTPTITNEQMHYRFKTGDRYLHIVLKKRTRKYG